MNSSRPYILRALHQWIVDNECTPHILVDVNYPHVKVHRAMQWMSKLCSIRRRLRYAILK